MTCAAIDSNNRIFLVTKATIAVFFFFGMTAGCKTTHTGPQSTTQQPRSKRQGPYEVPDVVHSRQSHTQTSPRPPIVVTIRSLKELLASSLSVMNSHEKHANPSETDVANLSARLFKLMGAATLSKTVDHNRPIRLALQWIASSPHVQIIAVIPTTPDGQFLEALGRIASEHHLRGDNLHLFQWPDGYRVWCQKRGHYASLSTDATLAKSASAFIPQLTRKQPPNLLQWQIRVQDLDKKTSRATSFLRMFTAIEGTINVSAGTDNDETFSISCRAKPTNRTPLAVFLATVPHDMQWGEIFADNSAHLSFYLNRNPSVVLKSDPSTTVRPSDNVSPPRDSPQLGKKQSASWAELFRTLAKSNEAAAVFAELRNGSVWNIYLGTRGIGVSGARRLRNAHATQSALDALIPAIVSSIRTSMRSLASKSTMKRELWKIRHRRQLIGGITAHVTDIKFRKRRSKKKTSASQGSGFDWSKMLQKLLPERIHIAVASATTKETGPALLFAAGARYRQRLLQLIAADGSSNRLKPYDKKKQPFLVVHAHLRRIAKAITRWATADKRRFKASRTRQQPRQAHSQLAIDAASTNAQLDIHATANAGALQIIRETLSWLHVWNANGCASNTDSGVNMRNCAQ